VGTIYKSVPQLRAPGLAVVNEQWFPRCVNGRQSALQVKHCGENNLSKRGPEQSDREEEAAEEASI
jgi:hypothetical protein